MQLPNNSHLMYCLNIHPAENLSQVTQAIGVYSAAVKKTVCPDFPMALGLRLSRQAASELKDFAEAFRHLLSEGGFYVVSINGFPYGDFHGRRIKQEVYQPDWSTPERLRYTLDLAGILARLLPEGQIGTISTVPSHYGRRSNPAALANLHQAARSLRQIEEQTGRRIRLTLEPEPDCFLSSLESVLYFFDQLRQDCPGTLDYIGVCLDCCHCAVVFESPVQWLEAFEAQGIQVPKVQLSAAVKARITPENRHLLESFREDCYLHQTRIRSGGRLLSYPDLPEALANGPDGQWRIHFHVPLDWQKPPLATTADAMDDRFFQMLSATPGRHLEIETYSFDILAGPKPPVTQSIIQEWRWVQSRMSALGNTPPNRRSQVPSHP